MVEEGAFGTGMTAVLCQQKIFRVTICPQIALKYFPFLKDLLLSSQTVVVVGPYVRLISV
jgi:hypothetical protein